jgi:hypothetical protein
VLIAHQRPPAGHVQAGQPQCAHGPIVARQWLQLGRLLATGQHQAALVWALGQRPEQRAVGLVAGAEAASGCAGREHCLDVVEHHQAALLAQQLE